MTLILTELTILGIAMAADSAVTFTHTSGSVHAVPNAAVKLKSIPYLNAGVSCWGIGQIDGISTDVWLDNVIQSNSGMQSLSDFALDLANRLNSEVGPSPGVQDRLGFHLAGFEEYQGRPVQSFFHIHDGPSTALQAREPYPFSRLYPPGSTAQEYDIEGCARSLGHFGRRGTSLPLIVSRGTEPEGMECAVPTAGVVLHLQQ